MTKSTPKTVCQDYQITCVDISHLKPADYNPRKSDKTQERQLTKSLKEHGFVDPVIVNKGKGRENIIIGGHFRVRMAKKLGYEKVPVVYVNIPDIEEEKKLNLRLNRTGGEFDLDLLKEFDMEMLLDTGFDDSDLANIWDDTIGVTDEEKEEKITEEVLAEDAVVKRGQIYQLGDSCLMCGDATNIKDVEKLVGDHKIHMLYCDPPYGIGLSYDKGISGKKQYGGKEKDQKKAEKYQAFLKESLFNGLSVCRKNVHVFFWTDPRWIGVLKDLYESMQVKYQSVCLWIKQNLNYTQATFHRVYEPCVYGKRGKPAVYPPKNITEILNQEIDNGNRGLDDIMDLLDIWLVKRLPSTEYRHPTTKPTSLHEKPIRRCTKVGDNILDLFGGSGSTLRAAHQLKRKCFLMERDEKFCDVTIALWEEMTGEKAVLIEDPTTEKRPKKKRKNAQKNASDDTAESLFDADQESITPQSS